MKEITLEPVKAKGKYMRINFLSVRWDDVRHVIAATIFFYRARDREENRVWGTVLYANNQKTMEKMLQEYNMLYPVRRATVVGIPDSGERIICNSQTGYIHATVSNT